MHSPVGARALRKINWLVINFSPTSPTWTDGHVSLIVIVNSKLLKQHSKAKRRASAYSRALRQIRGAFQRIMIRGRLTPGCQRVRVCVKSEVFLGLSNSRGY